MKKKTVVSRSGASMLCCAGLPWGTLGIWKGVEVGLQAGWVLVGGARVGVAK